MIFALALHDCIRLLSEKSHKSLLLCLVLHICIDKLGCLWFRPIAETRLTKVSCQLDPQEKRNCAHRNLNLYIMVFIKEGAFENVFWKYWSFCPCFDVSMHSKTPTNKFDAPIDLSFLSLPNYIIFLIIKPWKCEMKNWFEGWYSCLWNKNVIYRIMRYLNAPSTWSGTSELEWERD